MRRLSDPELEAVAQAAEAAARPRVRRADEIALERAAPPAAVAALARELQCARAAAARAEPHLPRLVAALRAELGGGYHPAAEAALQLVRDERELRLVAVALGWVSDGESWWRVFGGEAG